MKWLSLGMTIVLFISLSANALADDPHYGDRYKAPQVINNYTFCDPVANAGNEIHHSNGTDDLQIGAGFAICDDGREGGKVSFGQRFCPGCPLLNISAGQESGRDTIWSAGFNWKIKIK